jgi:hypothetical protein
MLIHSSGKYYVTLAIEPRFRDSNVAYEKEAI